MRMRLNFSQALMRGITVGLALLILLASRLPAQADTIALSETVQAGETAVFTLEIHNETTASHTYTPTLSGLPDGLTISFSQGGPVMDKIVIPAQSAEQIVARVETARETPVGSYNGQFVATRDDGTALTIPLDLVVANTYAVQIASQTLNLSVFSGQEFTFDLTAVNSGAAPLTHVALQMQTPAKWIVQTDPAQVDSLAAGASTAFHAKVLVPPSQMAIDQPVKLTVSSDQVSSADGTVIVRVQKSPNFLYGAGLIIALAVAGVFLYFRRQGRR